MTDPVQALIAAASENRQPPRARRCDIWRYEDSEGLIRMHYVRPTPNWILI